jgi:hypothetical protein
MNSTRIFPPKKREKRQVLRCQFSNNYPLHYKAANFKSPDFNSAQRCRISTKIYQTIEHEKKMKLDCVLPPGGNFHVMAVRPSGERNSGLGGWTADIELSGMLRDCQIRSVRRCFMTAAQQPAAVAVDVFIRDDDVIFTECQMTFT